MEDLFRKVIWIGAALVVLALVIARYLVYLDERIFTR